MILSLTAGSLPSVRIVLSASDTPTGTPWTLTASYVEAGRTITYRPRGGAGMGAAAQVVIIDAAAPIRTPVTYKVSTGATANIIRTSPADDVMSDVRGSTHTEFRRTAAGGDPRTPEMRVFVSPVPGSSLPPVRVSPVAGVGVGVLEAVTTPTHTWAMRDLLGIHPTSGVTAKQQPLYLLHACSMADCDVPRVQLVAVTSAPNDRRAAGHPERVWSISYRPIADPEPNQTLALNIWDDLDEAARTWDQLDAMALTWDTFDTTDWDAL